MTIQMKIAAILSLILAFSPGTGTALGEWVPTDNLANPLQPVVAFVSLGEADREEKNPLEDDERQLIEAVTSALLKGIAGEPPSSNIKSFAEAAQKLVMRALRGNSGEHQEDLFSSGVSDETSYQTIFTFNHTSYRLSLMGGAKTKEQGQETGEENNATGYGIHLSEIGAGKSQTDNRDDSEDGTTHSAENPAKPTSSPSLAPVLDNTDMMNFLLEENDNPLSPAGNDENGRVNRARERASEEQSDPAVSESLPGFVLIDTVRFTDKVRMIHELMNPPDDLHPWLKWLLYSSRVNQEMLSLYYSTLKKRDQIYQRALQSKGKLAILYKNRLFKDVPIFIMPEWGSGDYSLVRVGSDYPDVPAGVMAQVNLPSS